jgi:hypothetical protein
VNRWRQRLAELNGAAECVLGLSTHAQNVQNVQNPNPTTTFEHFEQIEQRTKEPPAPSTWGEVQEERAAIVEHDGNIPRAWAEGFARLDPGRPPADVPPRRWRAFVDDVGRFLDGGFAAQAAKLGWGPYDLFGCDRDRPYARIDRAGLLWLLDGHQLLVLSENTATIETRTCARQTFRRKPGEPGRVLAWELV